MRTLRALKGFHTSNYEKVLLLKRQLIFVDVAPLLLSSLIFFYMYYVVFIKMKNVC